MQETISDMQSNTTIQHTKIGYSVAEISKLLGICERKVWEEIRQKKLEAIRIGARVIVKSSSVDLYLSQAEVYEVKAKEN